jgi:hypothetical protein
MHWELQDSIKYDGDKSVSLYQGNEPEYMMLMIEVGSDKVYAVSNGTYAHVSTDEDVTYYYAYRVSDKPEITPWKIYKNENS